MRLHSLHPGVDVDEIIEKTDFEIVIPKDIELSRIPSEDEMVIIRQIDPSNLRYTEVQDG